MRPKKELQAKARQLRQQGLSVSAIARELGVSKGSVSLWVRDIVLTEKQYETLKNNQRENGGGKGTEAIRQISIEKRITYQNAGREYAKKGRRLHQMGCMLYWAEGAKDRNYIHFINSDESMMIIFVKFLREELQVKDEDMRIYIHCHTTDTIEQERIKNYWFDLLKLPFSCLRRIYVKESGKQRINRLENGVCTVRVHNTELTMHIFGAIQEYAGFDNPDWLF